MIVYHIIFLSIVYLTTGIVISALAYRIEWISDRIEMNDADVARKAVLSIMAVFWPVTIIGLFGLGIIYCCSNLGTLIYFLSGVKK